MEWQLEFDSERDIVRVVSAGDITADTLFALASEVLRELARTGALGALIDHRKARSALSTLEIYQFPNQLTQMGLSKTIKIALVHNPDAAHARDFQFYENACCLLGMTHLSFTDIDAALAWLARTAPEAATPEGGAARDGAGVPASDG